MVLNPKSFVKPKNTIVGLWCHTP